MTPPPTKSGLTRRQRLAEGVGRFTTKALRHEEARDFPVLSGPLQVLRAFVSWWLLLGSDFSDALLTTTIALQ